MTYYTYLIHIMGREEKSIRFETPEQLYAAFPGIGAYRSEGNIITGVVFGDSEVFRRYSIKTIYQAVPRIRVESSAYTHSSPVTPFQETAVIYDPQSLPQVISGDVDGESLLTLGQEVHKVIELLQEYNSMKPDLRLRCAQSVVSDASRRIARDPLYEPTLAALGINAKPNSDFQLLYISALMLQQPLATLVGVSRAR